MSVAASVNPFASLAYSSDSDSDSEVPPRSAKALTSSVGEALPPNSPLGGLDEFCRSVEPEVEPVSEPGQKFEIGSIISYEMFSGLIETHLGRGYIGCSGKQASEDVVKGWVLSVENVRMFLPLGNLKKWVKHGVIQEGNGLFLMLQNPADLFLKISSYSIEHQYDDSHFLSQLVDWSRFELKIVPNKMDREQWLEFDRGAFVLDFKIKG